MNRKGQIHTKIKLVIVILSILLISYGWLVKDTTIAVIGAFLYLAQMLYDLIDLAVKSKQFRKGMDVVTPKNFINKLTSALEGLLVITSLIAMAPSNELYRIPAAIIWFGQVAVFILVGPIVELFANIQLDMTYGGWRRSRNRRRKK